MDHIFFQAVRQLYLLKLFSLLKDIQETRVKTAQTMAYSGNNIPSRQFQTVKTVAYCQDSSRLLRPFQTVKTVADCKDSCRPPGLLQTLRQVSNVNIFLIEGVR